MWLRLGIGVKIFSLSLLLLGITLFLSVFGVLQSERVKQSLVVSSQHDVPLQQTILRITENALLRRVAFEAWSAHLLNRNEFTHDASEDYRVANQHLSESFHSAQELLAKRNPQDTRIVEEVQIRTALEQVEKRQQLSGDIQMRAIEALRRGDRGAFRELNELLGPLQDGLQAERDQISAEINALAMKAVIETEALQQSHIWTAVVATAAAFLLGLLLAYAMTRRITGPVRLLVHGVQAAEAGDLSTVLPVHTHDEIGTLTNSFNAMIAELRAKQQLRDTFGKYVDPKILANVILNPSVAEPDGGRRVMTISFGDLVGFSSLSEELTPAVLVKVLNRHFELMAAAIRENGGVFDKMIGDAVMAFWGPPFSSTTEHALLACQSALAQVKSLDILRAELPEITGFRKHPPAIDLRMGLAAGEVVVGNLGSENTRSYTAIGDTVNLASRLEVLNRRYGTRILINREVYLLAGSAIEVRELDWIAVKGKTEPVTVYELLGLRGQTTPRQIAVRDAYESALDAYRKSNWSGAATQLQDALQAFPEDGPSQVLLERILQLQKEPPRQAWDGVLHLTEK